MMEEASFSADEFSDDADAALKNAITSIVENKSLVEDDPKETPNEGTVEELQSTDINDKGGKKSTTEKEPQENEDKLSGPVVTNNSTSVDDLHLENRTLESEAHQKQTPDKDKGAPVEETEQGSKQTEAAETDNGSHAKSTGRTESSQNIQSFEENNSEDKREGPVEFEDKNLDGLASTECSSPQKEISSPRKEISSPQKEISSPQKGRKRVGSPAKEPYDKEQESTEESGSIQRKKLRTSLKSEQLPKQSPGQSTLLKKPYQSTGKKRGRPPRLDKIVKNIDVNVSESTQTVSKDSVSTQEDSSIVKKSDGKQTSKKLVPLKRMRHTEKIDLDTISFFIPEGWFFIGSIRQGGTNVGLIDMYYWTPPPRVKLRSRQELMAYMQQHGLDYDPLQFFQRALIGPLIKKGVLKYHDPKTVVLSTSDEALISQLVYSSRPRQPKAPEHANKKEENAKKTAKKFKQKVYAKPKLKGFPHKKYLTKKLRNALSFQTLPKTESLSPTADPQIESREETSDKPPEKSPSVSTAKGQALSPESRNTKLREKNLSTPPVKEELVSPQSTTKKLRGRSYTAASPKLPAPSPEASNKVLVKEDLISPQKKLRGRPKRSVSTATSDAPSPPRSNTTLEERVKTNSKPKVVRSPYFSSSKEVQKNSAGFRREKTDNVVPPRSPFNLIQEDLFHDPWQMLIATIFLNSTSGRVAIPLALEFLKRWPTPQQACQAQLYDILDVIEPLGFGRTRAAIIIRFSHEFLTKEWKLPSELYGIGKYGSDSYKIFCMKNAWKRVESDDPMLMMYLNWRKATEHLRKRFMNCGSSSKDPDESLPVATNSVKSLSTPKDKSSPIPRKRLRTRTATK